MRLGLRGDFGVNETVGMPPTRAVYLWPGRLTTDAQTYNQVLVPLRVTAFQVFQKAAAPRDHRQQSPAGMMIFAVRLEMILELQNALTQDCYLYFWRAGVCFVNAVRCHYLLLRIGRQSHARIGTPRLTLIFFVLHSIAQTGEALSLRTLWPSGGREIDGSAPCPPSRFASPDRLAAFA